MILCYVTDRASLPAPQTDSLLAVIRRAVAAGVDWIQIREKDLSACELHRLLTEALALPNPSGTKFLVNSRLDVALAAGAAGGHLPSDSPRPGLWRGLAPPGFLIGVSCHTPGEVREAEQAGADYALFGPVFAPLSKTAGLPARGLENLNRAADAVRIPVLALGGVSSENARACCDAGAAGIAGITLFQTC